LVVVQDSVDVALDVEDIGQHFESVLHPLNGLGARNEGLRAFNVLADEVHVEPSLLEDVLGLLVVPVVVHVGEV